MRKILNFFYNQPEERQSVHWRFALRFAKELSCVDKNGNEYIYQVKCGDYKSKQEKYYYKKINDEVFVITDGIHMMEAGIDVERYIPWTPEHLEKDIDVEYILENLI